ncbi:uncharacterized protein LOC132602784 [Lycium barbarum]|uniref:uncharacterized protein LOC132602784 n=1 Tax=Lycium barbarum TaxID=112863 RepID=UPI00293E5FF1|nr:uncharacterized protein LOC132602784 [Lycium barbarum]
MRQFNPNWYKGRRKWLEYSITKYAAYCLCCYLFQNEHESNGNTSETYTKVGFKAWNKALERFRAHVGKVNIIYNKCFNRILDLMNQSQSIQTAYDKKLEKDKSESRRRLSASVDVTRFLLRLGLSFCGHDESQCSSNRETIKAIIEDLDGDYFGILVDESKDISHKEQMTIVLRYVNKESDVVERFVGIIHVSDTSAPSLKELTLVAPAKKNSNVDDFFCIVTNVLNIVGASFKCRDLLREHQAEKLEEQLISGEVHTGRGLNQERGLQRPGDTRWGSHYRTLDNLIVLFPSIIHVLEFTGRECPNYTDRLVATSLVSTVKEFDFTFMLHLMWKVLMMTNELSSSLQRMDQDIVNAMGLLALTKQRLQKMRDSEFELLMDDVSSFCDKYDIIILKMDASYFPGRSKRRSLDLTYSHHLRVDIFYAVIDLHLQELKNRFDALSTDLLLGMASLNPINSFGNFDKNRIMRLVECYMNEFSSSKLRDLSCQLDSFIVYARGSDKRFFNLKGISDHAKLLVKSDFHQSWPLVYLLIKLTLILPVATVYVEQAFSSRKHIKNELRNSIGDEFLNGCLSNNNHDFTPAVVKAVDAAAVAPVDDDDESPLTKRPAMELFHKAKAARLQSHHDKYLAADEDEESVTQDRNGASKNAKWFVEFVEKIDNVIRLKSCYGKYLTASNQSFLLGMTGMKVLQTLPQRLDSSMRRFFSSLFWWFGRVLEWSRMVDRKKGGGRRRRVFLVVVVVR